MCRKVLDFHGSNRRLPKDSLARGRLLQLEPKAKYERGERGAIMTHGGSSEGHSRHERGVAVRRPRTTVQCSECRPMHLLGQWDSIFTGSKTHARNLPTSHHFQSLAFARNSPDSSSGSCYVTGMVLRHPSSRARNEGRGRKCHLGSMNPASPHSTA